ncbi:MAG: dephospho-CoA kinase, partial [Alphaproteobacteria bacterium]|nr:dephospho-CoA kinase [Alphaproteobacteria bacterium]
MHVIGITGCIGSGKSFVSNILSRMINAYVIN